MTIANVALTDTFDVWRTRTNQTLTYLNRFDANNITFTSNSPTLTITGTGRLGTVVYFDIGTLSTSVFDSSTSNIASANSVFTAYNQANTGYNQANTANTTSVAAFEQANTANTTSVAAFAKANNALANTSGVTFVGDLKITGVLDLL